MNTEKSKQANKHTVYKVEKLTQDSNLKGVKVGKIKSSRSSSVYSEEKVMKGKVTSRTGHKNDIPYISEAELKLSDCISHAGYALRKEDMIKVQKKSMEVLKELVH